MTLLSPLWSLISWSTLPSMNIFVWPRRTLPSLSLPRAPLLATLPSPSQCVTSKPASLCLNSLVLPLSLAKILGLETERIPRLFVLYRANKPIFYGVQLEVLTRELFLSRHWAAYTCLLVGLDKIKCFLGCMEFPLKFVWVVLKANLVLCFGPNHVLGFAFWLGPSWTIDIWSNFNKLNSLSISKKPPQQSNWKTGGLVHLNWLKTGRVHFRVLWNFHIILRTFSLSYGLTMEKEKTWIIVAYFHTFYIK